MGAPVESVFVVHLCIAIVSQFVRVMMVRKDIGLSMREYISRVIIRLVIVTLLSFVPPMLMYILLPDTIWMMIAVILCSCISVAVFVMLLVVTPSERQFIIQYVKGVFSHLKFSKHKQVD